MELNTCRVCLNSSSDVCRSLFEKHGPDKMSIMLKHVTGIEIMINSQLPNKICNVCWKDAITAYDLKNRFIQSHNELEILLQKRDPAINEIYIKIEPQEMVTDELQIIKTEHIEIDFQNVVCEEEPVVVESIPNVESIEPVTIQIKEAESKSLQFECVKCVRVVKNKNPTIALKWFRKHMHKHNLKIIKCYRCDPQIQFVEQINLTYHEFIVHKIGDKNPLICKDCDFVFEENDKNFWNNYRAHVKTHIKADFGCELCFPRKIHYSAKRLQYHQYSMHQIGENPFACKICKMNFNSINELVRHGDTSGSKCKALVPSASVCGKTFKCYICNEIFATIPAKIEHVNKDHADKANSDCHLCLRKRIPSASAYEKHLSSHLTEYRYICSYCGRGFHDESRLRSHINGFHETKYLFCDICGAKNKSKNALQKHMQTVHLKMRNYKCNQCPRDYTSSATLEKHQFKLHGAEPRYKCEKCQSGYTLLNEYNKHFLICNPGNYIPVVKRETNRVKKKPLIRKYKNPLIRNENKKSYECKICHKISNQPGNHKRHMMMHAEVKPYVCDICNKRFAQKGGMQTHRRVHTGEKPYSCTICSKAFSDQSTRFKHMKNTHKNS